VQLDPAHTTAHVEFLGKIDRRQILTLQRHLESFGDRVSILRLDVSRVSGLDMRRLAMLQMLCSSLERMGVTAIVIGVSPELQFVALEARLQNLINFG
jgi:ABC-type transporter Mla MlaB component